MNRGLKITQLVGVLMLLIGVAALVNEAYWGTLPIIFGTLIYAVGRVSLWLAKP